MADAQEKKTSKNGEKKRSASALATSAGTMEGDGVITATLPVCEDGIEVKRPKLETSMEQDKDTMDQDNVKVMEMGVAEEGQMIFSPCTESGDVYRNIMMDTKGPSSVLQIKSSAQVYLLVMMTNDVEWESNRNKENESTFTSVNFVPLRVMDTGYNKAPYEEKGAKEKLLVFFDKKGKAVGSPPVNLATSSMSEGTRVLEMKTWKQHPTASMKTKWRGAATDIVGVISPGVPLVCNIFNENKDTIMDHSSTQEHLKPFSLAIIGIGVKSLEQCEKGYGITVKSIKHVSEATVAMQGLYTDRLFYNDTQSILEQTKLRLEAKTSVKELKTDLAFVSNLVRRAQGKVSEKPIVFVKLAAATARTHAHKIHIQPNNKVLELQFSDEASIYHGKNFRVHVPENMFTMDGTGLEWIQFYFQWLLDANACNIMIVHDDYQFNRMDQGTGVASMHCVILPDEQLIFQNQNAPLAVSPALISSLKSPVGGRFESLDLTKQGESFSAWQIRKDPESQKTFAILFDKSRVRIPKATNTAVSKSPKLGNDDTPADPDDDDDDDVNSAESLHSSVFCRVYTGMHRNRTIWKAYLVTIDDAKQQIVSLFPVGVKSKAANAADLAGTGSTSASADIYQNAEDSLD